MTEIRFAPRATRCFALGALAIAVAGGLFAQTSFRRVDGRIYDVFGMNGFAAENPVVTLGVDVGSGDTVARGIVSGTGCHVSSISWSMGVALLASSTR